ncbi:MAG: DNA gyrase/topoisomerase IV subunit A, partial [Muribaculaceae bacterium]|nr:DNA gyrase/topoisomerase IV subunit A [Muribaculaceae bacterium]
GSKVLWFTVNPNGEAEVLRITLKPKKHLRVLQFDVDLADLAIKGKTARGNMVTKNEIHRITLKEHGRSTLGDREVWFDQDILRLNYEGHGVSLGKFAGDDRILVIMRNGDFYTTSSEATNHYEEGILRIMKYDRNLVWTAVLYDADQGYVYLKRFTLDDSSKKQRFLGENPESRLLLLTSEKYPRLEVKFGGDDSVREPMVIDAEEFIAVKSIHAKGKRVSNFNVDTVTELEPRIVEEEPQEPVEPLEVDEEMDNNSLIDQQEVRDKLTGQTRLFEEDETEI